MAELSFTLDDLKRLIGEQAIEIALLKRAMTEATARYDALVKAVSERAGAAASDDAEVVAGEQCPKD